MSSPRLTRLFLEAMIKHLPPSASSLRLLDVGGAAGDVFRELRQDIDVVHVEGDPSAWALEADSLDAVVAFNHALNDAFMGAAHHALRPGGRLVVVDPKGGVSETPVHMLEGAGYTRILVESAIECPLPTGVLMRGEKPHTTADTLERIQQTAEKDENALTLDDFKGRYVHVLVMQTPNKPVWAMDEGETYRWQAITANGALLAFSSLPKAVGFMQPAVVEGLIKDVNKVGKFSKETAAAWTQPLLLNPTLDDIRGKSISHIEMDTDTAEAPDE